MSSPVARFWRFPYGLALAIGGFGFLLCWILGAVYGDAFVSLDATVLDLIVSLAFWLIALFTATQALSRTGAFVLTGGLSLLTFASYQAAGAGDGSTAGLAVLVPLIVGVPAVLVAVMIDGAASAARSRRRVPNA